MFSAKVSACSCSLHKTHAVVMWCFSDPEPPWNTKFRGLAGQSCPYFNHPFNLSHVAIKRADFFLHLTAIEIYVHILTYWSILQSFKGDVQTPQLFTLTNPWSAPLDVLAGRCLDLLTGIVLHFLTAPSTNHRATGCHRDMTDVGKAMNTGGLQDLGLQHNIASLSTSWSQRRKASSWFKRLNALNWRGKKLARNKMKRRSLRLSIIKFPPIRVESAAILERWLPCKHHGHCRRQPRWWTCRWETSHGLVDMKGPSQQFFNSTGCFQSQVLASHMWEMGLRPL